MGPCSAQSQVEREKRARLKSGVSKKGSHRGGRPQPVQHAIQAWPLIVAGIIAGCVLLLLLICLCWAARGRVKQVAQSKRDAYRQRRADSVPIVADAPRAQPPRKGSIGKRRGSRVAVDDEEDDDDDTELI